MSDLFSREISFNSVEAQYCVLALTMLENRMMRQRAKAVPGTQLHRYLGQELETCMSLRNRFNYIRGDQDATSQKGASAQSGVGAEVSSERQSDQGS